MKMVVFNMRPLLPTWHYSEVSMYFLLFRGSFQVGSYQVRTLKAQIGAPGLCKSKIRSLARIQARRLFRGILGI